jgi:hypothetical protein
MPLQPTVTRPPIARVRAAGSRQRLNAGRYAATRIMSRHRLLHSPVFQYLLVGAFALTWGLVGRLALSWFLRVLGFNERPESSMLAAIGPIPIWAGVAVVLWTPLTQHLRRATVKQSFLFGGIVVAAGTIILYALFVFQMGPPAAGEEVLGAFGFFPIFVITAFAIGGIVAVPVTLATAVFLRAILRAIQPPEGAA